MIINTDLFLDFPVEFKEINPSDFQNIEVVNGAKTIINPDSDGYINTDLQECIDLSNKDTTIINAAVGQGKSYSIIQTIKRYYNSNENYMIIVAAPFKSLVKQYTNDIHAYAEIPQQQIYNYTELETDSEIDYRIRKIQVVTVNTLLGNPGEEGFRNSLIKRKYLNDLIKHCQDNRIKVIFIYDEIHDAIQNFKEEFIFNLWKWKDVIHKNFIISATFNEASKVVIEYLAELTDKKIKIIESSRIRFPHKQSKLFLHYNSSQYFTNTTTEFVSLTEDLIHRNKNIDILCYSKKLSESIISGSDGVGKLLKDKYGEINNCTSQRTINNRNNNSNRNNNNSNHEFKNDKCNVGTNFKTGVSINKRNHAFIIILPQNQNGLVVGWEYSQVVLIQ